MDLRATEVTRWLDNDLNGLAFGNEHHCFVVQRSTLNSDSSDYFISTERSVLNTGGILEVLVSGNLLLLRLSEQAARELDIDDMMLIDLSETGSDRLGAVAELSAMIGFPAIEQAHLTLTR